MKTLRILLFIFFTAPAFQNHAFDEIESGHDFLSDLGALTDPVGWNVDYFGLQNAIGALFVDTQMQADPYRVEVVSSRTVYGDTDAEQKQQALQSLQSGAVLGTGGEHGNGKINAVVVLKRRRPVSPIEAEHWYLRDLTADEVAHLIDLAKAGSFKTGEKDSSALKAYLRRINWRIALRDRAKHETVIQ